MAGRLPPAFVAVLPPKPRIESLSDLIFGLALSIGALALIAQPVLTAADLLRDLVDFAFGFIVLIAVWVRYTGSISYLTIETHGVLRLNILMLFLVAIEPYLFNQVFGSLSAPQVDRALANLASAAYAIDLSTLMGVLASFEHLAAKSPSIPAGSDIANSFLRYRNIHLLVAGVFLISFCRVSNRCGRSSGTSRSASWERGGGWLSSGKDGRRPRWVTSSAQCRGIADHGSGSRFSREQPRTATPRL